MSTDITQFQPDPSAQSSGMFVAVGTDRATGRAIVALDAAAVDALTHLLDDVVYSDQYMYPDNDNDAQSHSVASAIVGPLLKLQGFLS
jgi:hypothetical protein